MRGALGLTLGISLCAHVVIAGALVRKGHDPTGTAMPAEPAPTLAGETFELPAPESVIAPLQNASPSPEVDGIESPSADGDAPTKPTPKQPKGKPTKLASKAGRPSGGHIASADGDTGGTGGPALYGAVGDRSAADVATAFVRGFPQAASADPAWKSATIGSAGDVDVILTIDESGHFVSHQVVGSPSPALSSGINRTIALIKGRAFIAKGKTTKLHLSATVASDQVHDGLHGDVFAIGGSFVGTEGNAFFALNIGRRIDVHVRAR